jgi:hypothetical protein
MNHHIRSIVSQRKTLNKVIFHNEGLTIEDKLKFVDSQIDSNMWYYSSRSASEIQEYAMVLKRFR